MDQRAGTVRPPARADANISLLIPTKDRPHFLFSLLDYYHAHEFAGRILIGDSSSPAIFEATRAYLASDVPGLCVEHFHLPNKTPGPALKYLMEYVKTPYALFLPDDDYAIPAALTECARFLDRHPDYAGVHGDALILDIAYDAQHVSVVGAVPYPLPVWEQSSAAARVEAAFSDYKVSTTALCRTEAIAHVLRAVPEETHRAYDKAFYDELVFVALTAAHGKMGRVDLPYIVRLHHGARGPMFKSGYAWVTGQTWYPSYVDFINKVADSIAQADGIPASEALSAADGAFSHYLTAVMSRPRRGMLGRVGRTVRGAQRATRDAKSRRSWKASGEYQAIITTLRQNLVRHYARWQARSR